MRFLSLDLETTGLNPQTDQILMIGAVVEDTRFPKVPVKELPTFGCYLKYVRYEGDAYALAMNGWILDILSGRASEDWPIYNDCSKKEYLKTDTWTTKFQDFLYKHFPDEYISRTNKIILAGKNVANFDYQFLPSDIQRHFDHRIIDPGNCFIDWKRDRPLGLNELKRRFEIEGEVTHNAVEDARDVIRILRKMSSNYETT